jgi:ABC-type branched-subunit amino acid transport system ATPase component
VTFHLDATLAARGFDVSLSLGPVETVAILGPNGAGKSTLFAIIAGLLRPDTGTAQLGDKVLFDLAADKGLWSAPHTRRSWPRRRSSFRTSVPWTTSRSDPAVRARPAPPPGKRQCTG